MGTLFILELVVGLACSFVGVIFWSFLFKKRDIIATLTLLSGFAGTQIAAWMIEGKTWL